MVSESARETDAEFSVELTPADGLLSGTGRFDMVKRWTGGIAGAGTGVMLSAGDPGSGTAGYVALERFDGNVDGRSGGFALQQFGRMVDGAAELRYEIVPGSGTGELEGITGVVELSVVETSHTVRLRYSLR